VEISICKSFHASFLPPVLSCPSPLPPGPSIRVAAARTHPGAPSPGNVIWGFSFLGFFLRGTNGWAVEGVSE
jgi:hypothetical protein